MGENRKYRFNEKTPRAGRTPRSKRLEGKFTFFFIACQATKPITEMNSVTAAYSCANTLRIESEAKSKKPVFDFIPLAWEKVNSRMPKPSVFLSRSQLIRRDANCNAKKTPARTLMRMFQFKVFRAKR